MRIRILGENPVYSEGLASFAARHYPEAEIDVRPLAADGSDLMPETVQLVLVELGRPGPAHLETLRRLTNAAGKVILFSDHDSPQLIRDTMELGLKGFIPKGLSLERIRNAFEQIDMGGRYVPDSLLAAPQGGFAEVAEAFQAAGADRLTPRQRQVWAEMGKGRSNQAIASVLGISIATVKLHVNAVLKALGVRNRTEAAILAHRLLPPQSSDNG